MKSHSLIEQILEGILLVVLIVLLALSVGLLHQIRGTSRVINYAGIVRGCTQRLVKRELSGYPSDDLITYLDGIMEELQHGGTTYSLVALQDEAYQNELSEQEQKWETIQSQIKEIRSNPSQKMSHKLISTSEDCWNLCDKTVSMAESYSEGLLSDLNQLEYAIIIDLAILGTLIIHRLYLAAKIFKQNILMNQKVYEDSLTGIKNRKYYDEIADVINQEEEYSVIFIDLDHLKYVNDTFGHDAGDLYIRKSVDTIKGQFRTTDLMFRLGGDEFLLYLKGCKEDVASRLIQKAREMVVNDNSLGHESSFSYGICAVDRNSRKSFKEAVELADQRMYEFKQEHRIERGK